MYDNQANLETTNIFETLVGALNLAPTKISGQYKIVIDINQNLWLDDYSGRRVIIDKSNDFLPQVSNFLKTKTICDSKYLKYGGYHKNKIKSYHIPLYLNSNINTNEFPKYFVLNRVVNQNIPKENENYLYKYGQIQQVIDLEKLGIYDIFEEILSEKYYNYPLYFNWEESKIDLYGLSIDKGTPVTHSLNLINSMANQPKFENLNNKILNTFKKENIIFPKFINLEFEFEYSNSQILFHNFYGYLSNFNLIEELTESSIYCKLKDYQNKIEYNQLIYGDEIILNTFEDYLSTTTIFPITNKDALYQFKINDIRINDVIKIYHPNNSVYFEYRIKSEDINPNDFYNTLFILCKKLTKLTERDFIFNVIESENYCIINIKSNIIDSNIEDYRIELPLNYIILDRILDENKYNFRSVKNNDIKVLIDLNTIKENNTLFVSQSIKINDNRYTILDIFGYDSETIIRLNSHIDIDNIDYLEIFENKTEIVLELKPIPFLSVNSKLKSHLPYIGQTYINELLEKFAQSEDTDINSLVTNTVEDFSLNIREAINQYVIEEDEEFNDTDIINIDDYNSDIIKNMIFSSIGQTSFITPNTLNIDRLFYQQNGNIDIDLLEQDLLRFNWFLIKGECPEYLKNDIRNLRYFDDKPKLTSKLINTSSKYSETIFLGVKYQLPIKYVGYQFATYININDISDESLNYKFHINNDEKTIYLSINKYLDFCDLIRGGDVNNEPLLDLSFFYYVTKSYNINSDNLLGFKSGGIKLCQPFEEDEFVLFNGNPVNDWKYQHTDDSWYICLRRENLSGIINDFTTLFPLTGDGEFYVYSDVEYQGNIVRYISMTIKVLNIKQVEVDYLWCEDIEIKFFDTPQIFVNKLNIETNIYEIFQINQENIISLTDVNSNIFGDYHQIAVYLVDSNYVNFELLLTDRPIRLKEFYFEITTLITEDSLGNKTRTDSVFKFPEFISGMTDENIIEQFLYDIDDTIYEQKITIFDRNQVWRIIQDVFLIDLKFKFLSEQQIRLLINNFMVTALKDYSEVYQIEIDSPISENEKFVKLNIIDIDRNVVVWKINEIPKIVMLNRQKSVYYPFLELVNSIYDFQLSGYKINETLFNIYDNNFGGDNISATGLWQEVEGNIISSLFCMTENIEIVIPYQKEINIKDLLKQNLNIEQCIVNNNNEEYISKINANINEYILDEYTKYLLINFYFLDTIKNELGQRLTYDIQKTNNINNINNLNTIIILKNKWEYNTIFNDLHINFVRK